MKFKIGDKEDNLELISNEFVLPEKWCIKTENNITGRIIGKWFDDQAFKNCYVKNCLGDYYHSHNNSDQSILKQGYLDANFAHGSPKPGYREITFDQFKQYVVENTMETTKEPIFEVDKWYKINNCWYAKFNSITDSGKYWKFSERITSDKEYHDDHSSLENYKDFPIELLTDLSEIQEYLPYDVTTLKNEEIPVDSSLVGRYLKALKNNPRGVQVNIGNYVLIFEPGYVKVENSKSTWACSFIKEGEFELMPKEFKPCEVKSKAFELDESHIGKYVSLTYGDKHYDKVWVTREDKYIYLLNNCHSNNDGHSNNRNTFQFSLRYDDFKTLNVSCNNIQLLDLDTSNISEKWEPKVGDWVMVHEEELPITSTWLGENGKVKHQGPFLIEKIENACVRKMSGISVLLSFGRFRKAEPHEIPKTEVSDLKLQDPDQTYIKVQDSTANLTMGGAKVYTAEEALAELKRMGFERGVKYVYMLENGKYDEDDICTVSYEPVIKCGGDYIDCGNGFLWSKENPSNLHRGPISGPITKIVDTPFYYRFDAYELKLEPTLDYSKPETLLTKTTLNY